MVERSRRQSCFPVWVSRGRRCVNSLRGRRHALHVYSSLTSLRRSPLGVARILLGSLIGWSINSSANSTGWKRCRCMLTCGHGMPSVCVVGALAWSGIWCSRGVPAPWETLGKRWRSQIPDVSCARASPRSLDPGPKPVPQGCLLSHVRRESSSLR